jgi:hypothetical protein
MNAPKTHLRHLTKQDLEFHRVINNDILLGFKFDQRSSEPYKSGTSGSKPNNSGGGGALIRCTAVPLAWYVFSFWAKNGSNDFQCCDVAKSERNSRYLVRAFHPLGSSCYSNPPEKAYR